MSSQEHMQVLRQLLTAGGLGSGPDEEQHVRNAFTALRSLILASDSKSLITAIESLDLVLLGNVFKKAACSKDEDFRSNLIDTFKLFLNQLPSEIVLKHFEKDLKEALLGDCIELKVLWLQFLNDRSKTDIKPSFFYSKNSFSKKNLESYLALLIHLLGDQAQEPVKWTTLILLQLAKTDFEFISHLFGSSYKDMFNKLLQQDEITRLRVYDLCVSIGAISESLFQTPEIKQYIDKLLSEINENQDILAILGCIELVQDLLNTSYGTQYLHEKNYVDSISKLIQQQTKSDFGNFTLPKLLVTFSILCKHFPQALDNHTEIIELIVDMVCEQDNDKRVIVGSAIDSLIILSQNCNAKITLNKIQQVKTQLMPTLGRLMQKDSELKDRAIHCLATMIEMDDSGACTEVTNIVEDWFVAIDHNTENTIKMIIQLSREPFSSVKLESFHLLRILCSHMWGQKELSNHESFIKYLLDRSTENEKEHKEAKFSIVRELVVSPFTRNIFGYPIFSNLKKFYNEGPFFVDTELSVAYENGN